MTPAEADRQNIEDFANESADLLRRALVEAARRRAEEWEKAMRVNVNNSIPAQRYYVERG